MEPMCQNMILVLSAIPFLVSTGVEMAQSSDVRTDQGSKGSRIMPGPGAPSGNMAGGPPPLTPADSRGIRTTCLPCRRPMVDSRLPRRQAKGSAGKRRKG